MIHEVDMTLTTGPKYFPIIIDYHMQVCKPTDLSAII